MARRRKRRPTEVPECPPSFRSLDAEVKQAAKAHDATLVIVGDGSGPDPGASPIGGWAAVLLDRQRRRRKVLSGSHNYGTSMLSELMPLVHALTWHALQPKRLPEPVRVLYVTDCQDLVKLGTDLVAGNRHPDTIWAAPLWTMLTALCAGSYALAFLWLPRGGTYANRYCDALARAQRVRKRDAD